MARFQPDYYFHHLIAGFHYQIAKKYDPTKLDLESLTGDVAASPILAGGLTLALQLHRARQDRHLQIDVTAVGPYPRHLVPVLAVEKPRMRGRPVHPGRQPERQDRQYGPAVARRCVHFAHRQFGEHVRIVEQPAFNVMPGKICSNPVNFKERSNL